jgi:hypothetical protein
MGEVGAAERDGEEELARTHYPRKLPRVLAREQVARLIEAAPGPGLERRAGIRPSHPMGRAVAID